jgi:hypothetical protein
MIERRVFLVEAKDSRSRLVGSAERGEPRFRIGLPRPKNQRRNELATCMRDPIASVNVRGSNSPCITLAVSLDEKLLPASISVPGSFSRSQERMTSNPNDTSTRAERRRVIPPSPLGCCPARPGLVAPRGYRVTNACTVGSDPTVTDISVCTRQPPRVPIACNSSPPKRSLRW